MLGSPCTACVWVCKGEKHTQPHCIFITFHNNPYGDTAVCPFLPSSYAPPPQSSLLFILPPTKQKKRTSSIAHSQFIPLMTEMMPSFWLHTHLTTSRATAYDPFSLYPLNSLAIKACCSLCQKYRYADHSPIPPLAVTHMLLLNTFIYA